MNLLGTSTSELVTMLAYNYRMIVDGVNNPNPAYTLLTGGNLLGDTPLNGITVGDWFDLSASWGFPRAAMAEVGGSIIDINSTLFAQNEL